MLKKSLAFVLCILMLVSSISCLFTVNAATKLSENMVTLTNSTTITSVSKDTVQPVFQAGPVTAVVRRRLPPKMVRLLLPVPVMRAVNFSQTPLQLKRILPTVFPLR